MRHFLALLLSLAAPAFSAPNRSLPGARVPGVPSLPISIPVPALPPNAVPRLPPGAPAAPATAVPAAGDQLRAAAGAGEQKAQAPERRMAAAFDGAKSRGAAPAVDPPSAAGSSAFPDYLRVADRADRAWIAAVVASASRSPEAKRVLEDVRLLAERRNRPVQVIVERAKESGSFDYNWDVVSINKSYLRKAPVEAASLLIHELQHVLQRARGFIPSDALEMELEAYLVDMTVDRELGLPRPARGSFDDRAKRALARGADAFVRFLKREYKDNIALVGSSREEYQAILLEFESTALRAIARVERELARRQAAYEEMVRDRQPPSALESYREDEILPRELKIKREKKTLRWIRRDLRILASEEGYKSFKAYSDSVMRRLRREAGRRR